MTTSFSPPMRQVPLKTKVAVIAAVVLVAALGGLATDIGAWYLSLIQPSWKPPDWAFGPAWTIIFACTAISAIGAWHAAVRSRDRYAVGLGFAVNAFLNILWSVLFFKLQKPLWAAFEVFALWASIAWLMLRIRRFNPSSARWLAPYLIWVTYAASINWGVVWLNPNQAHEQAGSAVTVPTTSAAPELTVVPQPASAPQVPSASNHSTAKPEPKP